MSAIRFYFDEDAQNHALVRALRSRGIEIVTAAEADLLGQSDEMQLRWAQQNGCVLFTHNVADFCRLHAQFLRVGKSHSGIVVAEQGASVGERLRRPLNSPIRRRMKTCRTNWSS